MQLSSLLLTAGLAAAATHNYPRHIRTYANGALVGRNAYEYDYMYHYARGLQDAGYHHLMARGGSRSSSPDPHYRERTSSLQANIDDTVRTMRDNIQQPSQRGAHLDSIQEKTDTLATSADGLRRGLERIKKERKGRF